MAEYSEKHFSIDAGDGEKMDGCPYSLYEDGHDVQDYIIPPKGYKFIGFKCVMLPENRIYDGKLVAQYEKEPFSNRIQSNLKYIIIGVAALLIIGIVIALVTKSSDKPKTPKKPEIEEVTKPTEATETQENTETANTTDSISETVVETEQTPEFAPIAEPVANTPDEMFKQEFWGLIHQGMLQMDPYTDLYNKYKSQGVSGEEFEYLRLTILKDWPTYKEWYPKLKRIPETELSNLNTINDLITKLNEQ